MIKKKFRLIQFIRLFFFVVLLPFVVGEGLRRMAHETKRLLFENYDPDKETGPCNPSMCQPDHTNTCKEVTGSPSFECICDPGWTGQLCEREDLCHPVHDECRPHGLCYYQGDFDYKCVCDPGWTGNPEGKNCDVPEQEPDPCLDNADCGSHGSCRVVNTVGYKCECDQHFEGEKCNACEACWTGSDCMTPDPCCDANNQCVNGDCKLDGSGFECDCDDGWIGDLCNIDDPCKPNPCEHGGDCVGDEDGFEECEDCDDGWGGKYCDVRKQDTSPVTSTSTTTPTTTPVTSTSTTTPTTTPVTLTSTPTPTAVTLTSTTTPETTSTVTTTAKPPSTALETPEFAQRCMIPKQTWTNCLTGTYPLKKAQACDVCVDEAMASMFTSVVSCDDFESSTLRFVSKCGCDLCSDEIQSYFECVSYCGGLTQGNGRSGGSPNHRRLGWNILGLEATVVIALMM